MGKILSIIIPTYNMEEYLSRCVDSLVLSTKLNDLEIIIVNDGSKDSSLDIANRYKNKFPNSIIVIDKANGNYGSTINAALLKITGKYVKVLDADDWYDTKGLDLFVDELCAIECDMIFTPYTRDFATGKNKVYELYNLESNKTYDLSIFLDGVNKCNNLKMHMITYRSAILLDNNYKQTEGLSYTDNEWVYYPLYYVEKIKYVNINLYHHFIGRSEQTMNPNVYLKNVWQIIIITINMLKNIDSYQAKETLQFKMMQRILLQKICDCYYYSLLRNYSEESIKHLISLRSELMKHPNLEKIVESYTLGLPIKLYYIRDWNKTQKIYSKFIRWCLTVQYFVYRKVL